MMLKVSIKQESYVFILFIIATLFAAVNIFLQVIPISSTVHFQKTMLLDITVFTDLVSLYMIFYAIMQIPAGILLDKYGIKIVMPVSIFLTMASYCLFVFCHSLFYLSLSRIIAGIACSPAYILGIYIAATYFREKWLPLCVAFVESISTILGVGFTTTFHQLCVKHGWNGSNTFVIIFLLMLLVITLLILPKLTHKKSIKCNEDLSILDLIKNFLNLFKNKILVAVFTYSFFTWLIIMSFAGCWLEPYLVHVHKYPIKLCVQLIQIYWGSFLISALMIGKLLNTIQRCKITLLLFSIVGALDFLIMAIPIIFDYYGILLVVVFGGISAAGVVAAFSIAAELVPKKLTGISVATTNTFVALGAFTGQVWFGVVLTTSKAGIHYNALVIRYLSYNLVDFRYQTAIFVYAIAAVIALIAAIIVCSSKSEAKVI